MHTHTCTRMRAHTHAHNTRARAYTHTHQLVKTEDLPRWRGREFEPKAVTAHASSVLHFLQVPDATRRGDSAAAGRVETETVARAGR